MKKMLIAAMLALAAAGVRAAAVDWSLGLTSEQAGWSAYVFVENDPAGNTYWDIIDIVVSGNPADWPALETMATVSGKLDATGYWESSAATLDSTESPLIVLLLSDGPVNGSKYWLTGDPVDVGAYAYEPPDTAPQGRYPFTDYDFLEFGVLGDDSPESGDIPEPTSGLLLAVGGALLALRRKAR